METNKIKITIFGHTYNIQGDAAPDYMRELASFVNERMEEVSESVKNGNAVQIAILTALNIADEHFQLKKQRMTSTHLLEQKTHALISMLDEGLIGDIFSRYEPSRREESGFHRHM
ncbi:MAG: cell division protein ZapA [Spirochaetes bacterium]|nr:MAG: cell division protein ZapA [Spirochaetota bacterium]